MKTTTLCFALVLTSLVAVNANADSTRPVTIPFVDYGGIRSWEPVGQEAILIEGRNNKWYKATFFSPCIGLSFPLAVGFVTDPSGSVDQFSSILVDGDRCWFKKLEQVPAPTHNHAS
ncbi:MAG: hypothetical protein KDI19_09450 [Pseudomonadales bacterium]|nr:hypothetical protein [Pseudomonadales bacterium]